MLVPQKPSTHFRYGGDVNPASFRGQSSSFPSITAAAISSVAIAIPLAAQTPAPTPFPILPPAPTATPAAPPPNNNPYLDAYFRAPRLVA